MVRRQCALGLQVLKDLVDDQLILDTGDHFGFALWTGWPIPRLADVTSIWYLLLGANAPRIRVIFTLGLGTSASCARHTVRPVHKIKRFEDDVRGPIAVGRFAMITDKEGIFCHSAE